ncbi:hypothetical protein OOT00_05935 [Desulfobotulus sp. H1]|uniref:Uncharacterized protein n=1 Tax=Desulfobotulus pelophilus TaxID=2823377 RepID=A0ABT3N936_9BACT|nr:hypothetical protein [Desulfobotulus pelophilus]MCW7753527.1 hypothetical protein [Desulfobotulus pelophilus]
MSIQLELIDFIKKTLPVEADDPKAGKESEPLSPSGFGSDVSRAVHSALILRPIFELEARRFGQGEEELSGEIWMRVDLMWTAFAILDVISELTEYQIGVTRSEVTQKILPLLRQQVAAENRFFPDEALEEVSSKIFDHLTNRNNRYLPFSCPFFDADAGRYRTRRFWLIKNVYTGEGSEALFALTEEGYTAYFGLHETSALDAAAIGNLRIKLLIERGNLDDAIAVAETNRRHCARKAGEVRTVRRQISRNIKSVGFDRVQALAEEGVNQVMDIQKEGNRLHNLVIENLHGGGYRGHSSTLYRLADKLEGLSNQLMKLSGQLQSLPEDYQKHSHKLFRKEASGVFPGMDEVMERIFSLDEENAARMGKEFIARINPPAQRPLFDPASVMEACERALERRNPPGDQTQVLLEVDGEPLICFQPELNEKVMQQAFHLIHHLLGRKKELRLGQVLEQALTESDESLFPVATAMAVFQCLVEKRIADRYGIHVDMPDPQSRITMDLGSGRRYRGHELRLRQRVLSGNPRE